MSIRNVDVEFQTHFYVLFYENNGSRLVLVLEFLVSLNKFADKFVKSKHMLKVV